MMKGNGNRYGARNARGRGGFGGMRNAPHKRKFDGEYDNKKSTHLVVLSQAHANSPLARAEVTYSEFIESFYQLSIIDYGDIAVVVKGEAPPLIADNPQLMAGNNIAARQHNMEAEVLLKSLIVKRAERPEKLSKIKAKFLSFNDYSFATFMKAKPDRTAALDGNDWPAIMRFHKRWYLEKCTLPAMAGGVIDVVDQDEVRETWRTWHQPREMSVDQFANQFVIMVSTLEARGGIVLNEAEKARQFILKLNKSLFKTWQAKLIDGEDQQREYYIGGGVGRLPAVGYPQTMVEAIDRAKLQEQQINKTPASQKKQKVEKDLRSSFAMVDSDNYDNASNSQRGGRGMRGGGRNRGGRASDRGRGGPGRGHSGRGGSSRIYLTKEQQAKMSPSTSAKSFGYDACKLCDEGKNDHFWVHCPKRNIQVSRAEVAAPSGSSSVISAVTTYSEADVANIVELALQRERSSGGSVFSNSMNSGYRRMGVIQQPQYHFMNASFAAKQKSSTLGSKIVLINDTGSSSHDFPMHLIKGRWPIKKNPISHVPINTVQGTYYCEHMSNLPLLGDVHVNNSSDIVVLSLGLLRLNPHVSVNVFGNNLQSCRVEFLGVGLIINFNWQSNVLMGDASELMYVLDEMSYDNSTFANGEERVTYSRADVRGFIQKFESPSPSIARDAVIESHLFRHPRDLVEMSNDEVIKASGFFQRNPQFLPNKNEATNLMKAYTFMKEQGPLPNPISTYEDDELTADSEFSAANSGVPTAFESYRRAAVIPSDYLVSVLD